MQFIKRDRDLADMQKAATYLDCLALVEKACSNLMYNYTLLFTISVSSCGTMQWQVKVKKSQLTAELTNQGFIPSQYYLIRTGVSGED